MLNYIEEIDVTTARLSILLEKAVVEHVLQDDGDLYLVEDNLFPIWVHAPKKRGFVGFNTWLKFRDSSAPFDRLILANKFNQQNLMLTSYVVDDRLRMDHAISCREGLLSDTFIRACRNFSLAVEKSINAHDPHYEVLMRLKELSPSSSSESSDA